jgi:hypothetical protein
MEPEFPREMVVRMRWNWHPMVAPVRSAVRTRALYLRRPSTSIAPNASAITNANAESTNHGVLEPDSLEGDGMETDGGDDGAIVLEASGRSLTTAAGTRAGSLEGTTGSSTREGASVLGEGEGATGSTEGAGSVG